MDPIESKQRTNIPNFLQSNKVIRILVLYMLFALMTAPFALQIWSNPVQAAGGSAQSNRAMLDDETDTPTPTVTPTEPPTETPTATLTPSDTPTATPTFTETPTPTNTPTNTPTATFTPTSTPASNWTVNSNATLTPGEYYFNNLLITNNAVLTLQGNTSTGSGVIIHANNIQIDSGAKISANSQGYTSGGPGGGPSGATGSGGGYGGLGGTGTGGGGAAYGSVTEPIHLGSAGGNGDGANGSGAGGAIKLVVSGTLTLNGIISANGTGSVGRGGAGSGGSIWLLTDTLAGTGIVQVNGGVNTIGGGSTRAGGGAGGRIAVYYTTSTFSLDAAHLQAYGGDGVGIGGPGTVYMRASGGDARGSILVDNNSQSGNYAALTAGQSYEFASVTLTRRGHLLTTFISGGTFTFDTLTISTSSTLQLVPYDNGDTNYTNDSPFILNAATVTVDSTSAISSDGLGYPIGYSGPGGGTNTTTGSGGGYGGLGGTGTGGGGAAYGSVTEPIYLGSAGGNGDSANGTSGGGAIKLVISGTLTVNGTISANGSGSVGRGGAGSGGSIWIQAGTIAGGGTIRANGGVNTIGGGSTRAGGGAGGRIAVYYTTSTFPLDAAHFQAYGGDGVEIGGPGTVYIRASGGDARGSILVDNNSQSGNYAVLTAGQSYEFASVTLSRRGHLKTTFLSGGTFTFDTLTISTSSILQLVPYDNGDTNYTNDSPFILNASTVIVDSTSSIISNALGYTTSHSGPGGGVNSSSGTGSGGGYGGIGGFGTNGGGAAYGSVTQPIHLGSAGGNGNGYSGSSGGGAVKLIVSGTLTVNGIISANGGTSNGLGAAGSGGSIWIQTNTLAGSGAIQANGGNNTVGPGSSRAGSGAGGRIAVYYTTSTFSLDAAHLQAYSADGVGIGGPGTVYVRASGGDARGSILVDNNSQSGSYAVLPAGQSYEFASVTLSRRGNLNTTFISGGTFTFDTLTISTSSTLQLVPYENGDTDYTNDSPFILNSTTITVDSSGSISSDGLGYPVGYGGPGAGSNSASSSGGGGGYGGYGGNGGVSGGAPYGLATGPAYLGSAGGNGNFGYSGSNGGGAIKLVVSGTLTINGTISADGATSNGLGGSGSGGSIWIQAGTVTGSGTVKANGGTNVIGPGSSRAGGGSGGRIAIFHEGDYPLPYLNAQVNGGSGVQSGTVGTIYPPMTTPALPPSQAFATNECPFCNNSTKVYTAGQGINTWSGNYNYQQVDGLVNGVGPRLAFERSYNSLTSGANSDFPTYNDVLGYGWTHNYNVRLILTPGVVKLIAPRGSLMQFYDSGFGTYDPFPAVLAKLTRTGSSGSYQYQVLTNSNYKYIFNNSQQLTAIIDPQGRQTTLTYSGSQLTQVQDASGTRRLKFYYYGGGQIQTIDYVKVAGGETVLSSSTYTYSSGNLTSVTDFNGRVWTYQYTASVAHLLTKVIDATSTTVVQTVYDSVGRATEQYDGAGNRIAQVLNYSSSSNRQVVTAAGATTTVGFSGGLPVTVDAPGSSDSETEFLGYGINPAVVTDPNGNDTALSWSTDGGNLEQITDALGNVTELDYDALNNLIQVTDDLGRITWYEYFPDTTLLQRSIVNYEDGIYDSGEPDKDLITSYTYTSTSDAPEPPELVRTQTDPGGVVTRYTYTAQGQQETVTLNYVNGSAGPGDEDLITSYTYDDRGRLLTTTDPLGRVTKNEYDSDGNLFRVTRNFVSGEPQNDENTYNLITTYDYDAAGRLVKITDTLNQISYTCYDSAGRVEKRIQNPTVSNPCTSYTLSTDPALDRITTTTYDADSNVIATTEPDGVITRIYYDSLNRPVTQVQNLTGQSIATTTPPTFNPTNSDQNVRTDTVYDNAGNVLKTIDNTGRIIYNCYDALNRVVKTVQNPTVTDPCTTYTLSSDTDKDITYQTDYDEVGNVIASIDPDGNITRTYYDPLNRPEVVIVNLDGQAISVDTPPAFNPAYPDKNIGTQTFYDIAGRVEKIVDLTTNRADWTCYDDAGRVIRTVVNATVVGPCAASSHTGDVDENLITDYEYDAAGRQISATGPDGVIVRTYYDGAGRRTAVTQNLVGQAISVATPPAYNPANPDENVTITYTYDALGRVVETLDNAGLVSVTCYDALGRVVKTIQKPTDSTPCVSYTASTDPDEDIIQQITYDSKGDAIASIDPDGKIVRTYYDALHRPRYVVANLTGQSVATTTPPSYNPANPDQNVRQETRYDSAGRPFDMVDNDGMVSRAEYDLLDRNVETIVNYINAGPIDTETNLSTESTYDLLGNLIDRMDANGIVTHFVYDDAGRLIEVWENYQPAVTPTVEINVRTEYTYDAHGNRLSIRNGNATLADTADLTTFTYDALDRPLTETDPLDHTTTYAYTLAGTQDTLLDANGDTTTYTHDDLRRPLGIDYPSGTDDVAFDYDEAGNPLTVVAGGVQETAWTYDALYRPEEISETTGGVVGYIYDKLGLRQSLIYPDGKEVTYTYDGLNRLEMAETGTGWAASAGAEYTYNDFGALATTELDNDVTVSYDYDDAHRLTTITHETTSQLLAEYAYTLDEVGNRTEVTETIQKPQPSPPLPESIFANGFESNNLNAWSSSATGSGTLTVSTAAALAGTYGMQVQINSTTARYVVDSQPADESRYRARFYFDPNSITMANGDAHYIFYGYHGGPTVILRIELQYSSGNYQLRVAAADDSTTYTNSSWATITDAPHYIELDWQAATSAGANNGKVDWWIDDVQQTGVSGIDVDTRRLGTVRLGAVSGLDAGTTGTYYFDAFESRRQTYIGSSTALPEAILADDFESGHLDYWNEITISIPVSLSITTNASLSPIGTHGLSITRANSGFGGGGYLTDTTPGLESRYRARFYFDPNSITMSNNSDHVIFYGDSGTTAVLKVDFGYTTANGYRLRVGLTNDTSSFTNSSWVNITDAPHYIELDWQAATSAGANNGKVDWWIGGVQQTGLSGIDNDTRRIDQVHLGVVANVDITTHGTLYFDAFESRRTTAIGPVLPNPEIVTITYDYDPLYRLTEAVYSDGRYFEYTYDSVGNRQTEEKCIMVGGCVTPITNTYDYDEANRLIEVNSQAYDWDDNGNLLDDGTNTYTYDAANRLTSFDDGTTTSTYTYNGLGDRLSQTVNSSTIDYVLDLNTGFTQVLDDGTNTYLYGQGRVGELQPTGFAYHLDDALGSVRQLSDTSGDVTLAKNYEPFGSTLMNVGGGATVYDYTSEMRDASGFTYLRARYVNTDVGRFISRDTWGGNQDSPLTLNGWNYVEGNPINYRDASGHCSGFAGINASNSVMSGLMVGAWPVTKPWESIPKAYGEAWDTCVKSFQDAGAAIQNGDVGRALLHVSGITAALYQSADRIEQNNQDWALLNRPYIPTEHRVQAMTRIGSLGFETASWIITIGQATKFLGKCVLEGITNKAVGNLTFDTGMLPEYQSPYLSGQYRNWQQVRPYTVNWSQESIDSVFSQGPWEGKTIDEIAALVKSGDIKVDNEMLVFLKESRMDDWTPTTTYTTKSGAVYQGDWSTLQNGCLYCINNRGLTVAHLADMEQMLVNWADDATIYRYSYQYTALNYGRTILVRPDMMPLTK
jgi:RHS repeat-associated protein